MSRTIIIEGNSVYELDEGCMLKKAHGAPGDGRGEEDRPAAGEKEKKG